MNTQQKERPILFSAPMVRAILEGRKTMTRRLVKMPVGEAIPDGVTIYDVAQPEEGVQDWNMSWRDGECAAPIGISCPYGKPGDHLWVRETWREAWSSSFTPANGLHKHETGIEYRATHNGVRDPLARTVIVDHPRYGGDIKKNGCLAWRPSIHMPRWASRILLEVVSVRVELLQEITEADAIAEGVTDTGVGNIMACKEMGRNRYWFANLWDSLNAPRGYGWDANPWVWVVEFKRVEGKS